MNFGFCRERTLGIWCNSKWDPVVRVSSNDCEYWVNASNFIKWRKKQFFFHTNHCELWPKKKKEYTSQLRQKKNIYQKQNENNNNSKIQELKIRRRRRVTNNKDKSLLRESSETMPSEQWESPVWIETELYWNSNDRKKIWRK